MKLTLPRQVTPYLDQLKGKWHRVPETPKIVTLPIHEDLGGMSATEIEQETKAIKRRIELNVLKPEGIDGLNYRLMRLEAQGKALKRKK